MTDPRPSDAELEALLKEMFGAEPPPPAQAEFAIAAFSFPKLDEELAELVYDSTADPALTGVRSGSQAHVHLSFAQGDLALDAEWQPGSPIRLTGQFEAPAPASLTMHRVDESTTIQLDSYGEFELTGLHKGPIRFSGVAGDERIETDWFNL